MLRSIRDLHGYALHATDGVIGDVYEFLFDETNWHVRYMVADTGDWLPGRLVLVAPASFGRPDWEEHWFPVKLSKDQVEKSPDIDQEKPVSRQHEIILHNYYGWPHYWIGAEDAAQVAAPPAEEGEQKADATKEDPHLRSTREVIGYHIKALDGEFGHVADFIVDDQSWVIRYMVVDTRNWLPGRKVLVSPTLVDEVNWGPASVAVALTKEAIRNSPEYDASAPVNREYEVRLYDYYGRPRYWK